MAQHDWVRSKLGHGETMCSRCFITNREAAALGVTNSCDVPPPAPKAVNDNAVVPQDVIDASCIFDDDEGDEEESDGSEECGRWDSGQLSKQCSKAGSEECDWICPIGLP